MVRFLLIALFVLPALPARAERVAVAVAANFTDAAKEIGAAFEAATGHDVVFSFGSTGQLFAQIGKGAPFDVFLAADRARPARAEGAGLTVSGSRVTYATGRLVLFSRDPNRVTGPNALDAADLTRLAIANPKTAPYGAAAVAVLKALGRYEALAGRLVRGSNIAQAYQFVATGNADLGFVALSQVILTEGGSRWVVPEDLHPPIAQDAVLLKRGAANPAARAFLTFLRGAKARAIEHAFGYGTGGGTGG